MKVTRSYKTEDKIYSDAQKICEILSKDGNRISPSSIAEDSIKEFVEENKHLLKEE